METVEVVIRIPKKVLKDIQCVANGLWGRKNLDDLELAILDGTVLPKGHGRLVDAEKIAKEVNRAWTLWEKKGEDCYLFADVLTPMLISQPTVIEADRGDDNG